MKFNRTPLVSALLGLLASACGGAICARIGTPLPWMVGSLGAMALLNFSGARLMALRGGQPLGQTVVATGLGLYFTPAVAAEVGANGLWLVLAALFSIALGYAAAAVLSGLSGSDRTTAFFASVPGGAVEMSLLGERYGARVDRIALAQSLRILIVVCTVPMMITLLDIHGSDVFSPIDVPVRPAALLALLASAAVVGKLASAAHLPTPFFFGPLVYSIALTISGTEVSAVPLPLVNAAQVLLGCALGARFSHEFLRSAPRFLAAASAAILFGVVLSAVFGALLAWAGGLPVATMVLATAPGGITEMCVTAKVLQLGVPLVTAAHVTRVLVLITVTGPLFGLLRRWRGRPPV